MYFKQLDLCGFKSFADRTTLRLDPGVTAVVGPNGCGKSNILDAMRWVLGEQSSKALRGSHMQDVIFNGSDKRHALGMAEVAVTFDNADSTLPVDFAEVKVTRRLYRSGESEYLLNNAACRLKDINDIFTDTGIGTQAYSMIGQGKMDLILSQKPEDRRFLFEEAAGIIKYKNRKKLAVRRLESAEQNLLRLQDIIAEIERQMRSLKRQVNAAIRYRELSEQLRDVEIRAAWLKYTLLTGEIGDLREQLATAEKRFAESSAQVGRLEARREEVDLAKLEADRELMNRREGVHALDSEMDKLERQVALLNQQIEFSRNQQQQAVEERESFQTRARELTAEIDAARINSRELAAQSETLAETLSQSAERHREAASAVEAAEQQVEAARSRAVERMNVRARTQTEIETLEVRIANVDKQLEELYARQNAEDGRRAEALSALEAARVAENERRDALAEAEQRRDAAAAEQSEGGERLRAMNERWQSLREEKSSLLARMNSLRELRDNYEGFAAGVRNVMKAKDADARKGAGRLEGIIGPAGDLLSTETRYERAIEAALGGNINNVVVEDAASARNAVAFLKQNNAGRVTFLPLDIIRGGRGDTGGNLRNRRGVIGPAIDHVQFDAHIAPAAEYLLHSTLIVETLDDAIEIARDEKRFPRLVTLDGEVVSSAGAVTGGRTKHESRGILGRSAEIAELEDRTNTLTADIARLGEEAQRLTEAIQEAQARQKEAEQQAAALNRELNELGVRVARQQTEIDNLGQSLEQVATRRDELSAERERLESQRTETAARADTLASDDEAFQQEVAEALERASQARQALSVVAAELGDLRVKQAEVQQQRAEAERAAQRLEREHENALREAERRLEVAGGQEGRRAELEQQVRDTLERSRGLSDTKAEAQGGVTEAENARQTLLDEGEAIDQELRTLRDAAKDSQAALHKAELDLRSREERVGFFQQRILEEYNVALASLDAEQVGTDEHDDETRDSLVADLRQKLQRMGDVNLMAIEEYEALEERHTFLTGQCADLEKAREALLGVIARSDRRIREMFLETFEEVANHFREYFRVLFNGGQARIYLVDEDDPLESGIEIEARPPGKKPTSISLLSGGESAMTAIALLFSILKAKPTPFCILDEVDAPLDDANIGRFLSLLDDFAEQTQFIVITHNKNTMARADAMYGVTMQERGVSQLISARLTGAGESAA